MVMSVSEFFPLNKPSPRRFSKSTPTENSTNEFTIGLVRVVLSRLKPDVKHKDLAPLLQVPLDALLKAMGALTTAKNLALDDQGHT